METLAIGMTSICLLYVLLFILINRKLLKGSDEEEDFKNTRLS